MFNVGDIVKIKKDFQNPGETDRRYRVVNVNAVTERCYIELEECDLPLSPQELVSFAMIEIAG